MPAQQRTLTVTTDKADSPAVPATPKTPSTVLTEKSSILVKAAWIAGAGVAFGLALHKSGVYRSDVIRSQFVLPDLWNADNTMLSVFLSASAMSALSIAFLNSLGEEARLATYAGGGKKCAWMRGDLGAFPALFCGAVGWN